VGQSFFLQPLIADLEKQIGAIGVAQSAFVNRSNFESLPPPAEIIHRVLCHLQRLVRCNSSFHKADVRLVVDCLRVVFYTYSRFEFFGVVLLR
jgi:hypothetical protein